MDKIRRSTRGPKNGILGPATFRPRSACQIAFPLGFGHFSAQIRLPDRIPARVWAIFRPKMAHDRQQRSQERSKIANEGPERGPRPPTEAQEPPRSPAEAPRATQDRPHKPQELSKTAHRGPKFAPRSPAEAPRTTQERTHRPEERPKATHRGPSTSHSAINRKYT